MTLRHGVWARTPGPGGGEQWRGAARAEAAHPQAEEGGEGEHQEPGEAGAGAGPHRHQQRQPRHRTRNRSASNLKHERRWRRNSTQHPTVTTTDLT